MNNTEKQGVDINHQGFVHTAKHLERLLESIASLQGFSECDETCTKFRES